MKKAIIQKDSEQQMISQARVRLLHVELRTYIIPNVSNDLQTREIHKFTEGNGEFHVAVVWVWERGRKSAIETKPNVNNALKCKK